MLIVKKNRTYLYIFGSVIIIVLGIALVAILDKAAPQTGSATDIRAQAGTQYTLKFTGLVNTVNQTKGTVDVTNVQMADSSRQGSPQDLGEWTVTPPAEFNFASVSPGMSVTIGVDASTFNIANHAVTAITLTPGN
jgi:hypothetical protein